MVHAAVLAVDRGAARLHRRPTLGELNTRIERAEADVVVSQEHAARAEQEIQKANKYRRENHLVELVRSVFGDVK
jgi:hypothetical protein